MSAAAGSVTDLAGAERVVVVAADTVAGGGGGGGGLEAAEMLIHV